MKYLTLTFLILLLTTIVVPHGKALSPYIGKLEIHGMVREEYQPISNVSIFIKSNSDSTRLSSNSDGRFSFQLQLQKKYKIIFSKEGYFSKQIEFHTQTPESESDIIYQYEFNVALMPNVDLEKDVPVTVAKVAYVDSVTNFMHLPKSAWSKYSFAK